MTAPRPDAGRSIRGAGRTAAIGLVAVIVVAAVALIAFAALFHARTSAARIQRDLQRTLTIATDSAYRISIGRTRASLLGRRFQATDVVLTPDSAVLARLRKAGRPERTHYGIRIPSIRLEGIDLSQMARRRVVVRSVSIDSMELDASLDRTGPLDPEPLPAMLPHDWVRQAQRLIRIDTARLERGVIRYAERSGDGSRFGTIVFDRVGVTILDVTNDSAQVDSTRRARVDLQARIGGQGRVRISARYDLLSDSLRIDYEGSVAGLDARRLNSALLNLEGMRVREGILDSAWFKVAVEGDVSKGTVQLLYHDLESEIRDKSTHKRGLKKKIKTFIANHFVLRTDNRLGKDPVAVPVRMRRPPFMGFFEFVWKTLRMGLLETLRS